MPSFYFGDEERRLRQDLGKVLSEAPGFPVPTLLWAQEQSAESRSLQSPHKEQHGVSYLEH